MGKGRRRPCLSEAVAPGPNAFSITDSEILQPAAAPGRKRLPQTIATVSDSTRTTFPDDRDAEGRSAAKRFQSRGSRARTATCAAFSTRRSDVFAASEPGLR